MESRPYPLYNVESILLQLLKGRPYLTTENGLKADYFLLSFTTTLAFTTNVKVNKGRLPLMGS